MDRYFVIFFLALVAIAPGSRAAEEWVEKEGVVREIDMAARTAIISGYRYYFGTSSGYQTPEMQLTYYPRATFEMLQVGMKVQFHFTPQKPYRRILRLRQLTREDWLDDEGDPWLDNDELPDAIPVTGNKGT